MLPLELKIPILGLLAVLVAVGGVSGLVAYGRARAVPPQDRTLPSQSARGDGPVPGQGAVAVEVPGPRADLRGGLGKTRSAFIGRLGDLLRGRSELDAGTLEEVEGILFGADLGVQTADSFLEVAKQADSPAAVRSALRERALEILNAVPAAASNAATPHVVLVVGVNGSGKTTTIGKLASRYKSQGKRVLMGAGDTYRAAAIDQLGIWAERAGVEIIKGEPGGDPAAVAFDAVEAAVARKHEIVLLDTAGRLQTDRGLMDELAKIVRVVRKEVPDAPHEVLLVLDANTGQNAIRQAKEFKGTVEVDHIALTKLDGTAKGGVVLGIAQEVGLPVRYVGIGEAIEDLVDFDPELFVEALFSEDT